MAIFDMLQGGTEGIRLRTARRAPPRGGDSTKLVERAANGRARIVTGSILKRYGAAQEVVEALGSVTPFLQCSRCVVGVADSIFAGEIESALVHDGECVEDIPLLNP